MNKRRGQDLEPWVSLEDQDDAKDFKAMYGGMGSTLYTTLLQSSGGMRVFIRSHCKNHMHFKKISPEHFVVGVVAKSQR